MHSVLHDNAMALFVRISLHRMCSQYLPKIRHCIGLLSTSQVWDHEANQTNSIGGILLHICEQIRRNTVRYHEREAVFQTGIEDYFPEPRLSKEILIREVEYVFSSWRQAVEGILAEPSREVDVHSMYHLVEHTSYHLGQIVDRVQRKTGTSFRFVQSGLNEQSLRTLIDQAATAPGCQKNSVKWSQSKGDTL